MKVEDWIKVEDRLPEDGQICLIVTRRSECYAARWEQRTRIFMVDETNFIGFFTTALTHWMPIVLPNNDCKCMDSKLSPLAKPCPNFTPKEN